MAALRFSKGKHGLPKPETGPVEVSLMQDEQDQRSFPVPGEGHDVLS